VGLVATKDISPEARDVFGDDMAGWTPGVLGLGNVGSAVARIGRERCGDTLHPQKKK